MEDLKPEEAQAPTTANRRKATDEDMRDVFESFAVNVVEIGIEPRMLADLLDFWIDEVAKQAVGPDQPGWNQKQRLLMGQFRKFKVTPLPEARRREQRQIWKANVTKRNAERDVLQ